MNRTMPLSRLLPDVALPRDIDVSGLVMDSRELKPGDAFVAIAGFGTHGLAFAAQASAAGAAAILFEPPAPDEYPAPADAIAVPGLRGRLGAMGDLFHGHPSHAMTMVGVTGTNGKTSTVQLLAQAWHLRGVASGSVGTLGAGRHGQVQPTGFTTPLVLRMHALLGELRDSGVQAVAMEVSSHALDQGRVDGVHYDVAVFTNLTRDHLDYHGDMASYGAAKARLFGRPGLKAAVLNLDDAFGRTLHGSLADGLHGVGVSSRGQAEATLQARELHFDSRGVAFDLVVGEESHPVRSPLLGRFNVDNLMAVAGVLHALGDSAATIAATLSRLQPVVGRMNRLGGDGVRPLVVVDYAHTPDALAQALTSLRAHAAARLICVFGCGGERDRGKRPQMAQIAEAEADVVIVTDDNPRAEDGDAIVADILAGFDAPQAVTIERDRGRAIARAIGQAGPDDIVLVAGKGHEPYQDVAGVRHPFDDTDVARHALEGRA
ncbi:UDP-N-acetylmuramoyl-L-alanyl-D-glutamate--2,6-diaminopimelate ligase [Pseudoxanthomonas sp. 10H]|uniref:UDP-N-acetylmuramoyl-L-alanyl-D-glutamate--2, 6-diaminopimelate ligase n=1 Tax=Pseudoxanthomonas sp. 10H TaxID=3242729 RepID=UPI003555D9DB